MLCVRAEDALAAAAAVAVASDKMRSVTLGGTIQRAMRRIGGGGGGGGRRSAGSKGAPQRAECLAPGSGADASASCSADDSSNCTDKRDASRRVRMRLYRSELEQEVEKLQRQLEEEIDLQLALTDAITNNATLLLEPSAKLPNKAQELIISIASLENIVSKLEEDLNELCYQLCHLRNDTLVAESNSRCLETLAEENSSRSLLSTSFQYQTLTCKCIEEEHISTLRDPKLGESESMQEGFFLGIGDQQNVQKESEEIELVSRDGLLEKHRDEEIKESNSMENGGKEDQTVDALSFDQSCQKKNSIYGNVWNDNPNKLSEEMVRCMRDIFLRLSESSSEISPKGSSNNSISSAERLSGCTLTSISDSSLMASVMQSPSIDSNHDSIYEVRCFDPYKVNGKEVRRDIGNYSSVAEVSWMYVGKEQLAYASEALKNFRILVEQLSKVDPTCMNCDERLAFWINLYNALIMHAYLAYGVPENDIKLFSLMQKACYMVGGQSFSAAEIEFVILKMKTPLHRPQLSLMLALHKFRVTEEHKKFSIDDAEPLVLFALSCGMFSSPAVRIFSAGNVRQELQESMRDYIRASVGINDSGKLIVPKLLQSYAKGTVEDSLLADWICRHLTPNQVAAVQDTSSSRKQRLLGVCSFSVVPFDSKFRYLFLPDKNCSQH
ncbi:uncharacterized protein LOC102719215 [Oryza brachyantha]|uniref:DUF547 domain-containing protein n=1 Tax=Oryza brachyantha TaxID=4533 RepID=J3MH18_ORYBR|nr:uncharacterized protein LOC102719215 [Oryza brachyantha]